MRQLACILVLSILLLGAARASAADYVWPAELASYFRPPPEASNLRDSRRSPLVGPNGARISTVEAWRAQRELIRARWFEIIGAWPPLLPAPKLERVRSETRENFQQHFIRLEISPRQMADAILLVPQGPGPFPAVVVPFYDPQTSAGLGGRPLRDFGYQLAKRGFVALCLGAPGGDAYRPDRGEATCQPLAFLAYIAANAHTALTQLPEVDHERIGIVGHSYGGKWALFASCLYDKFAAAAWSDPGIVFDETRPGINYQEPWYLGLDPETTRPRGLVGARSPRTGAYKRLVEQGHDLHELHALMAPRPLLVSGGAEDPPTRWAALRHAREVYRLFDYEEGLGLTHRPTHDPTPDSNAAIYRFFEHTLGQPR